MNVNDQLLDAYFDAELTAEQASELCEWVKASPEHAQRFARRSLLHGLAREQLAAEDLSPFAAEEDVEDFDRLTPPPEPAIDFDYVLDQVRRTAARTTRRAAANPDDAATPRCDATNLPVRWQPPSARAATRYIVIPRLIAYGLPAALAAIVLLYVSVLAPNPAPSDADTRIAAGPHPGDSAAADHIATVGKTWQAQWDQASTLEPGIRLREGARFTLTQGFAELHMRLGARVMLEAPCIVELLDENAMRLTEGKLVAEVSPQATGFTVRTPGARIVDVGTEFGAAVREGMTHVRVFRGQVDVTPVATGADAETWVLKDDEAIQLAADGQRLTDEEVDELYVRQVPASALQWALWRDGPLMMWSMDEPAGSKWLLGDGTLRARGQVRGAVMLGEPGAGVTPADRAARFRGDGAYIDAEFHPQLASPQALTIEAWIYVNSGRTTARIVSTRDAKGGFGFGVDRAGSEYPQAPGGLLFTWFDRVDVVSRQPVPVGRWTHVAAVVEGATVALYIDGQPVPTRSDRPEHLVSPDIAPSSQPLCIGRHPTASPDNGSWDGLIDELVIFDRALSPLDIQTHYALAVAQRQRQ